MSGSQKYPRHFRQLARRRESLMRHFLEFGPRRAPVSGRRGDSSINLDSNQRTILETRLITGKRLVFDGDAKKFTLR